MKYLLLKHYRGAPAALNDVPFERWAPGEFDAHVQYMNDFAEKLTASGEYVESHALAQDGVWVRFDGEGRTPWSRPSAPGHGDHRGIRRAGSSPWPGAATWTPCVPRRPVVVGKTR